MALITCTCVHYTYHKNISLRILSQPTEGMFLKQTQHLINGQTQNGMVILMLFKRCVLYTVKIVEMSM